MQRGSIPERGRSVITLLLLGALFGFILCPIIVPVIIIMVMKFVGAMICRFVLDTVYKGDFKNDN